MRALIGSACVKESVMNRPTFEYDPAWIARLEREARRARDEHVARLIRQGWRRLFRRAAEPRQAPAGSMRTA